MKKKVLLAFSGGLDTSYCARYLAVDKGMDVHTVVVNTGGFNSAELEEINSRAISCSVTTHKVIDRVEELYSDVLRYCIAGNILKNASYPLSVSAERIVQAIAIAEYAREIGATAIAHGSTGAGNDQIRFDMIFQTICPDLEVITPIRDMKLSREDEISYLSKHGVVGDWTKSEYSINQGLWGTSVGGRETLTSSEPLPTEAFPSSRVKQATEPLEITIGFERGEPASIDGQKMSAVALITELNRIGASYQIGRDMHVGDTIIGIKGRVAFEAPAAMMVIKAHHLLEKHTLSKWQLNLKDQLSVWYGQLLHEGQYLDQAMRSIEAFYRDTQITVSGTVRLRLSPQRFDLLGIESDYDLMKSEFARYGEENTAWTGLDARGFAAISSVAARLQSGVKK